MDLEWGLLLAIYLFLAGAGAGAFILAVAVELLGKGKELRSFVRAGTLIAGPLTAAGMVFLVLDLGWVEVLNIQPWRMILLHTNFNPTSMISWGTWILTFFIPLSFLYGMTRMGFKFFSERVEKILRYTSLLLAFGTAIYTGLDLSVVSAIPFWNNSLVPVLFLISALSTGLAASIVVAVIFDRSLLEKLKSLYILLVALVVTDLVFVFFLLFITSHSSVEERASTSMLLTGQFSPHFWVRAVLFLLAIFLAIKLIVAAAERSEPLAIGTPSLRRRVALVAPLLVLAGGFILRYLVLEVGVPVSLI